MPIRLILFLAVILAGFLYLTFFNTQPVPISLGAGVAISLPISILLLVSFATGVITVMLLYFYDTFVDAFRGLRRSSSEKRARRVAQLFEAGEERLLIGARREAQKYFRKALAHEHHHVPSLIALGRMMREDGEFSEAIKMHSKARGIEEANIAALLELAEDYVATEQFAHAVTILQETQKRAGKSAPPLIRIRDIFLRVKNTREAVAVQQRILALVPESQAVTERRMLAALKYEDSLDSLAEGLLYEARDGFKSVLRHDSQFIPAYLKLAEVFERVGHPRDAVKILEKGFKNTHSLVALKALEMFLTARGDVAGVVERYKWARGVLPGEKAIRLFLAEAYLKTSDFEAARREIESLDGAFADSTLYHLVTGKIRQGEKNIDLALDSLTEAYQREVATFFRFTCTACNNTSGDYAGRCRACGAWNTLKPALS